VAAVTSLLSIYAHTGRAFYLELPGLQDGLCDIASSLPTGTASCLLAALLA